MRKVVFILLFLCLAVGFPIPSRADSIGTASLTWHFGDLSATRAFGLDQSTGGGINYHDPTLGSPWAWGSLLASQWPASDGLGNSATGKAERPAAPSRSRSDLSRTGRRQPRVHGPRSLSGTRGTCRTPKRSGSAWAGPSPAAAGLRTGVPSIPRGP